MALDLNVIGQKIGPLTKDYAWRDVVLYALGVGAGYAELDYVYEANLKVIPSFAAAANFDFLAQVGLKSQADLTGILHGAQENHFFAPIPTQGTLITQGAITRIIDKGAGKGALVTAEAETSSAEGRKLFSSIFTLFCRHDGGFGGLKAARETFVFPDRPPDFEESALPSPDQPLLYRLSGDVFALHVDPNFARAMGFERPIMHGLCTHGFATRAIIKHLLPGEPERLRSFKVRFSKPLYPGVRLVTKIWKITNTRAVFRTLNFDSQEIVLDNGLAEWDEVG